jgi:hypothetical protein
MDSVAVNRPVASKLLSLAISIHRLADERRGNVEA